MKNLIQLKPFLILFIAFISFSCSKKNEAVITSPDGAYVYALKVNPETSEIIYNIRFHDEEIIGNSKLGFSFIPEIESTGKLEIVDVISKAVSSRWTPVMAREIVILMCIMSHSFPLPEVIICFQYGFGHIMKVWLSGMNLQMKIKKSI